MPDVKTFEEQIEYSELWTVIFKAIRILLLFPQAPIVGT